MPSTQLRLQLSTVILLVALPLLACGSVAYRGSLKGSGDSVRMALAADVAEDVPEEDTRHVRVYTADNLPPGLRLVTGLDGRRTLLVDTKRYDFAAELQATAHSWTGLAPYTFYPYNERWRRWACWWQTPLQWTFIFIYWNIVPTSWVCWVSQGGNSSSDVQERQSNQIRTLKRLAVAVGADTVVYDPQNLGFLGQVTLYASSGNAFAYDDKTIPNPTEAKYASSRIRGVIPAAPPSAGGTSGGSGSFTDTVVLKNGVELSGVSVAVTKDSVVVTYASGKTVVLSKTEVAEIKKGGP